MIGRRWLAAAAACLVLAAAAAAAPAAAPAPGPAPGKNQPWDLQILHFNDNHARFAPADYGFSTDCDGPKMEACFGGMARQTAAIKAERAAAAARGVDTLTLHAGDQFSGTVWENVFTKQDNQIAPPLLREMGIDAFVVGNHEFDNTMEVMSHFLGNLTEQGIPVLSCNLDTRREPALDGIVQDYTIIELPISKRKVGVVGLTTVRTPETAEVEDTVRFKPYSESLPGCIAAARADGAEAIILVTHLGYQADLDLAKESWASDVDVIVGGHTHTFLAGSADMYDPVQKAGEQPTILLNGKKEAYAAAGPYPTWVQRAGVQPVPIVQAGWASRYLGALNVTFDGSNKLRNASGSLLLMGGKNSTNPVPDDPEVAAQLAELKLELDAYADVVVGEVTTELSGNRLDVRSRQTNLGTVACNAFIDYVVNQTSLEELYPGAPVVCLTNSGGIRASVTPGSPVTRGDLATVFPLSDTVVVKAVDAKTLQAALAHAADAWTGTVKTTGAFLQMGGVRYGFDPSVAPGSGARLLGSEVLPTPPKGQPRDPAAAWQALDGYPGKILVVSDSFIAGGGDGFDVLGAQPMTLDLSQPNVILVGDYISANTPMTVLDNQPEDALSVNCGDATASAGSKLCLRSAATGAAAVAAPAPSPSPPSAALRTSVAAPLAALAALLACSTLAL